MKSFTSQKEIKKRKNPAFAKVQDALPYFFDLPEPLQQEHVSEPPSNSWKYPFPEQYGHSFESCVCIFICLPLLLYN
jgi:hypothetical protein